MRPTCIAVVLFLAACGFAATSAHAVLKLPLRADAGPLSLPVAEKNEIWLPYYRRHGKTYWRRYYRDLPQVALVRPLSCGEFRFWDGQRCVDVRATAPARTLRGRARTR